MKTLREEKHKRFCRSVDGPSEFRCEADGRTDVDDRPLTHADEPRGDSAGEPGEGVDIQSNGGAYQFRRLIHEYTGSAHAGIIDQNPDLRIVAEPSLDLGQLPRLGEVSSKNIDSYRGLQSPGGQQRHRVWRDRARPIQDCDRALRIGLRRRRQYHWEAPVIRTEVLVVIGCCLIRISTVQEQCHVLSC